MNILLRNPRRTVEVEGRPYGDRPTRRLLNDLEARSPGAKAAFYLNFLDHMAPLLAGTRAAVVESLGRCARCGSPTTDELCAFYGLVEVAAAHDPVPVGTLRLRRAKARR